MLPVLIAINCHPSPVPAVVVRERDGRRVLDAGPEWPLLTEGEDCEVVPEREVDDA